MARTNSASDPKEKTSETSRNQPNWDGARRQVVDFIGACINKDVNVSLEWRERIFQLLKLAALAPDDYLDADRPVVTPRDYLTDAINTMRGRALEKLLQYGLWVRRNAQDADLSELFQVVQLRFAGSPALALAEYALLGLSFYQLCELSASWTKENVSLVFPQSRADAWGVGFGTYLKFNRAHRLVFEMLSPHLNFAVDNLRLFKDEKNPNSDSIGKLGEHRWITISWGLLT